MMKEKTIEISGKKYVLTANRSIVKTLYTIAPDMLKLSRQGSDAIDEKAEISVGLDVMANLDVLFYDMIKVKQPNITKDKSDKILEAFEEEYENVQPKLLDLAMSVFQLGDQANKKKIDW